MCREGMDPLEFKNLSDCIQALEQLGWEISPVAKDMVKVTIPDKYVRVLGLVPNANEMFGTLWNAVCWANGFNAAMRYGEY